MGIYLHTLSALSGDALGWRMFVQMLNLDQR